MANIATVKDVMGKVLAQAKDGSIRILREGDSIADTDKIITGQGQILLASLGGEILSLAPEQTVAIDNNVFTTEATPTASDASVTTASIDSILNALDNPGDLNQQLDATAAGLTGGSGSNGGSTFVQLLRIVEPTDPLAYEYTYTVPDDVTVDSGLAAVTPEPTVEVTYETYSTVDVVRTPLDPTYGDWTETNRTSTSETVTTLDEENKQSIFTTNTTTTVSYERDVVTGELIVTTTTTYQVTITTTTNPDGTVEVVRSEPAIIGTTTDQQTDTTTAVETKTEDNADTTTETVQWNMAVTYEYYDEVDVVRTPTGPTYSEWEETGRNATTDTDSVWDEENKQDVTTTTTTTTVDYARDVTTGETVDTTTSSYRITITTWTRTDGTTVEVRSAPELTDTTTNQEVNTTVDVETRQEVLTDTDVTYEPWPVVVTYEYYTETDVVRTPTGPTYSEWEETGRTVTTETNTVVDEENKQDVTTTTTTTTVDYARDVTTGELIVTTTTTYMVTVTTVTRPDNSTIVTRSEPEVTDVTTDQQATSNFDVETNQEVLTGTDVTYEPWPEPEPNNENWFIAQQGNGNSEQAYTLSKEEPISFNVQFQDRSGEHVGVVHAGDTVDVKIQLTGEALNMLDILDIDPSKEFSAKWEREGDMLNVHLTNDSSKDANLQGNPFDVLFKVADDGVSGTNADLGFDILSATVGGTWETNDQVNYIINDMINKTHGNGI